MARHAQGWKLTKDKRTGIYTVRFMHGGKRYHKSTGTTCPIEARTAAETIYDSVRNGSYTPYHPVTPKPSAPLEVFIAEWLAANESTIDDKTYDLWELYGAKHWIPFFESLEQITTVRCSDYWRNRLKSVQVQTVRKELSALRNFLRWCHEHGYLLTIPTVTSPGKKAIGTVKFARQSFALTEKQVNAILKALPEQSRSKKHRGEPFWVRPRFEFAWETGMRPEMIDVLSVPQNYQPGATHVTILVGNDKNRMARPLPLTSRAKKALEKARPEVGIIFGDHDFRTVLRTAARAAGLPEELARRVTAHCFRHSRITNWAETKGDNLPGIQYLAGHTKASTTEKYIKASLRAAERVLGR